MRTVWFCTSDALRVRQFSRCGDITWGVNFYKGSPDLTTPLSGKIFNRQGGTYYGKSVYQI